MDISKLVENGIGDQIEISWRWRSSSIKTVQVNAYNIINNEPVFHREVSFETYSQLAARQQGVTLPRTINFPLRIELVYGDEVNDKLVITVSKNKIKLSYSIKEKSILFSKQKRVTLTVNNHTGFTFVQPIIKYAIVSSGSMTANQFGFLPKIKPDINVFEEFLLDKDKHIVLQCNDLCIEPKWIQITNDGGY